MINDQLYLVIAQNGLIKIGITQHPESRAQQIKSASPIPAQVLLCVKDDNCKRLERDIHVLFNEKRIRGEWFALSYDDIQQLLEVVEVFFLAQYSLAAWKELKELVRDLDNWGFFNLAHYELISSKRDITVIYRVEAFFSGLKV